MNELSSEVMEVLDDEVHISSEEQFFLEYLCHGDKYPPPMQEVVEDRNGRFGWTISVLISAIPTALGK